MALQVKRCTEEVRKISEIVLEDGQPLYTTDTHKLFIGDGTTFAKDLEGTDIGLSIENGTGKHSLVQIPLQYGTNEDGSLKYGNIATGSDAIALGISSQALNSRAVAIGNGCISGANTAFTIGQTNKNYANGSFTFGNGNIAGTISYDADGTTLIAGNDSGSQYSIVGGLKNNHRGQHCITVGEENTVESNSTGSTTSTITAGLKNIVKDAIASAIFGGSNTVDGSSLEYGANYNIVAGTQNILKSNYSVIFGLRNKINHPDGSGHSFVVGVDNYTQADATFLLGRGLYSTNGNQVVIGKYNDYYNNNSLFIVGNGSDSSNRSNAFEVRNSGEIKSSGVVTSKGIRTVDGGIFVGATIDEDNSTTNSTIALNKDGSARFSGEITSPTITNITSTIQSLGQTKADKATTLSGYGITDAYTKTEVDNKDTATLNSAKSYTDTTVGALDGTYKNHSAYRTVDTISQTDGKVNVSYKDIEITKNHITDLVVYGEVEGNSNLAKEVITLWYPEPQAVYILVATKFVNPITSSEVEKVSHKVFTLSDVTSLTSVDGNSIQYIKGENKLEIIGNPGAGIDMGGQWVTNTQLKLITL